MRSIDVLRMSLQNLWRTKFRSFLTVLGVVIGISAIVLFVSLGVGLEKITSSQIASISSLTTISVTQTQATSTMEEGKPLTDQVYNQMKEIKNVTTVSPSVSSAATLTYDGSSTGGLVYGIKKEHQDIETSTIIYGAEAGTSDEAVITSSLASALCGDAQSLIGRQIKIELIDISTISKGTSIALKIVGIDDNETTSIAYADLDKIYSLGKFEKYSALKVKVKNRGDVDAVKEEIKGWGFQTTSIKDLIDQVDKFFLLVQIILGVVSGIGLLVSSLGIINTMTISLLERTREIGIMKAIGASSSDIKKMFFTESILIGVIGGLIGVGIAFFLGQGLNYILNIIIASSGQTLDLFVTPIKFSIAMVIFAIFISVLAGLYPARRAQKLPLIVALYQ